MAKDIKLDDYGDLDVSTGDLENIVEEQEVAQFVETKILKIYDEDVYALEEGVPWFKTPSIKGVAMYDFGRDDRLKVLLLKSQIITIPEVTGIVRLEFEPPDSGGQFGVDVQIDTIYSDVPLEVNS